MRLKGWELIACLAAGALLSFGLDTSFLRFIAVVAGVTIIAAVVGNDS